MKLWKKNGKLIVDENKQPILCDECPCDRWWIEWGGQSYYPGWAGLNNSWSGPTRREWYGIYHYDKISLFNYLKQLENRMFATMYFDKSSENFFWGHQLQDYIFDSYHNNYRNTTDYFGFWEGTGKYDLSDRQTYESYFTTESTAPSSVQNADNLIVNGTTRPEFKILRLDEADQWRISWPWSWAFDNYPGIYNPGFYGDIYNANFLYYVPYNDHHRIVFNDGGASWSRVDPNAPLSSIFKLEYLNGNPGSMGYWSDAQDETAWNRDLSDYSDFPIGATLDIMGVGRQYDTGKYASLEILSTSTDNWFPMYDSNNNLIMPKGRCDIYIKINPGHLKKYRTATGCVEAKTYNEEGYIHTWFEVK